MSEVHRPPGHHGETERYNDRETCKDYVDDGDFVVAVVIAVLYDACDYSNNDVHAASAVSSDTELVKITLTYALFMVIFNA